MALWVLAQDHQNYKQPNEGPQSLFPLAWPTILSFPWNPQMQAPELPQEVTPIVKQMWAVT